MKDLKLWTIKITEQTLSELLKWAVAEKKADRICVVFRELNARSSHSNQILESYRRFKRIWNRKIVDDFDVSGWAGTKLLKDKARLLVLDFDEDIVKDILTIESDFNKWLNPRLPEDIYLYKSGSGFPLNISITHEQELWVINDYSPPLAISGVINFNKRLVEELYIFNNKHFAEN